MDMGRCDHRISGTLHALYAAVPFTGVFAVCPDKFMYGKFFIRVMPSDKGVSLKKFRQCFFILLQYSLPVIFKENFFLLDIAHSFYASFFIHLNRYLLRFYVKSAFFSPFRIMKKNNAFCRFFFSLQGHLPHSGLSLNPPYILSAVWQDTFPQRASSTPFLRSPFP